MRRFRVRFAESAREDLVRLTEFLVEGTPERAKDADATIRAAVWVLTRLPFSGRRAPEQDDPTLRELVVPFGVTGYVILYRVGPGALVSVLAARHKLEENYH